MENGEADFKLLSRSSFWENYSALKDQINACRRKNNLAEACDTYQICADIEENILEHDDEEYLSPLPNKIRKLNAGTDLCTDVCWLQMHLSNIHLDKAVSELLDEKKYNDIADRITRKRDLELKREKFFYTQALKTIETSFGSDEDEDDEDELGLSQEPKVTLQNDVSQLRNTAECTYVNSPETERARAPSENFDKELPMVSNLSEVTAPQLVNNESIVNSELIDNEQDLDGGLSLIPASEIPEPAVQDEEDIRETGVSSDDLGSLPPVTVTPKKRWKKYPPVFDNTIEIPNYTERARRLNKSITIEPVKLYEGPQRILRAFTLAHALETPAVNNGLKGSVKSAVLERLYSRHQETQQVSHKEESELTTRCGIDQSHVVAQEVAIPHTRSRSNANENQLLDVSVAERHLPEMKEPAPNQPETAEMLMERFRGTPVSKMLQQSEVVIPQIPASEPWLPPRSPRIRNLQGKEIEKPMTGPWFTPVEQRAPQEKWREFKHVRERLEEIWRRKAEDGLEKEASLTEILESEWYRENVATLLRVVDKMSLRREVVLNGIGEKVLVQPFEMPYVTEKQYLLRFEELKL